MVELLLMITNGKLRLPVLSVMGLEGRYIFMGLIKKKTKLSLDNSILF